MEKYLMIGTVLKPQGIRGEIKIKSFAADTEMFRKWDAVYLNDSGFFSPVSMKVSRIRDGFVYAVLDGCGDADTAEAFRGKDLYIDRENAARPGKNAVLIADLIGCTAEYDSGEPVGTLTDVLQHGSVDTWVFRTQTGTLMAPALLSVFPEVLPEKKKIIVCRERLEEVAVRS